MSGSNDINASFSKYRSNQEGKIAKLLSSQLTLLHISFVL